MRFAARASACCKDQSVPLCFYCDGGEADGALRSGRRESVVLKNLKDCRRVLRRKCPASGS